MIESFAHLLKSLFIPVCLPIRRGPLKGFKWIAVSGSKFLRGNYEPHQTAVFQASVRPGDAVIDVGAHVGYYTVLAASLIGPAGRVVAFEPRPINLRFLKKHIQVNRLQNVTVIEAGVGEIPGPARFDTRTGTGTGHLSEAGNLTIRLVSLDELYRKGALPKPALIKIDVEGAEQQVLAGAREIISAAKPILLISTHGPENHHGVIRFLEAHAYSCAKIEQEHPGEDGELIARPAAR